MKELWVIAMTHTSREDVMGVIFNNRKKKAKCNKELDEGHRGNPIRKKDKRRHDEVLVATVDQKGRKQPIEEVTDHFEKLLEAPCPNHLYPV
jgi:hypothetical protein